MPDRSLRLGRPIVLGAVTLLPVECTDVHARRGCGGAWLVGRKQLHALIVRDAAGLRAVDADDRPMALDALRGQLVELDAWLGVP